jgi:polyferredoxin
MEKLLKIKAIKIALVVFLIVLFGVSLLPMFSPVMNVVRQLVGSAMIGWWTGGGIAKILDK